MKIKMKNKKMEKKAINNFSLKHLCIVDQNFDSECYT